MKKNTSLKIGLIITVFFILMAVISVVWTPYSTTGMDLSLKNQAPGFPHIFGTDNYGRDIFSRVMKGTGTTVFIAFCTVSIGCVFGTLFGLFSGYVGGIFDEIVMRICDMILSFPSILLALIFVGIFGSGKLNVILSLGILFVPSFARMARGETIKIKESGYIESANAMGISNVHILFRHILPNIMPSMLTSAAIGFNNAVLAEAGMSYLGLGVQPPEASLGRMLSEAQSYMFTAPWYAIFPGITIILIILGFSLISENFSKGQDK